MNAVAKNTPTRDLLMGSGVMLLVYGLAIAALISWFVLDNRKDEAAKDDGNVVEIPSTDSGAADDDVEEVLEKDPTPEVVAVADFMAVPEGEVERASSQSSQSSIIASNTQDQTAAKAIGQVLAPESELASKSAQLPPVPSTPPQPDPSAQVSTNTEVETVTQMVATTTETVNTQSANPTVSEVIPVQPVSVVARKSEARSEVLVSSYDDRPVLTLTGRVIDEQQAPISGIQVFVFHADNETEEIATAVTNKGGDFHLPALEKAPYIVKTAFGDTISVFDFARSGSVDLHIVSQQGIDVAADASESAPKAPEMQATTGTGAHDVAAIAQLNISGRVQSDLGAPLAGVLVRYNGTTLIQTGIDGSYSISLQPGSASKVSIQYKKDGHLAEIRTLTPETWAGSDPLRQDVVMRSIKME